jgi:hypothetical protein
MNTKTVDFIKDQFDRTVFDCMVEIRDAEDTIGAFGTVICGMGRQPDAGEYLASIRRTFDKAAGDAYYLACNADTVLEAVEAYADLVDLAVIVDEKLGANNERFGELAYAMLDTAVRLGNRPVTPYVQ